MRAQVPIYATWSCLQALFRPSICVVRFRRAALRALDVFYRHELAAAMGSDLQERDLTPPQHAQRAAALLADNTVELSNSYDVY